MMKRRNVILVIILPIAAISMIISNYIQVSCSKQEGPAICPENQSSCYVLFPNGLNTTVHTGNYILYSGHRNLWSDTCPTEKVVITS